MKHKELMLIIIMLALIFPACHKSTYVPKEDMTFNIEDGAPQGDSMGRMSYDDCPYMTNVICSGNNQDIYIITAMGQYKIDLSKECYSYLCTKLECEHDNSDCEMCEVKFGIKCYRDGIVFARGRNVYYREADGKTTKLFTNNYTTDYANEYESDPYAIYSIIFINENTVLLTGINYTFTYNLETGATGELIKITDSRNNGYTYLNGKLYSSVNGGKLFVTDLTTGKSKELAEQGINVKTYKDGIVYCKWNEGVCNIYFNNQDFSNEQLIIKNACPNFLVYEGNILWIEDNVIYAYDEQGVKCLCDTNDVEYEYAKLPLEFQNDDINLPDAKLNYCLDFYYEQGKLYMELVFDVYNEEGYQRQFSAFYVLDEKGELRVLEMI